ncbi:TPA: conjugal transfer protein [Enterococcus faecalis]|uniref:conjugal transfer protein n=1 Tax=Enterococcus faecalis TaxID=1351 RepID=UPI001EE4254D|nr:conjugal transfer protein [Enterococcus faecalis]EHB5081936.1 conjugal transfer protein [Enterococcus faecalis]EKK5287638.1 conjugal transfer protein [Enterococcus faecalis]MDK7897365.1 conjugal transfer protein [Enterococcus faecalis]UKU96286.1 conjugal transfer protein [Enterococcus faecalis]UKU98981.1 conjugal transfer protein [Enterococcus faecalis]
MIRKKKTTTTPDQEVLPKETKGKVKKGKREKKESYQGARKRRFLFLMGWGFLIFSVGFGIYNNLTSGDTNTVHETKVIDKQLKDVTGIENYVKNFVVLYFTVSQEGDQLSDRTKALESYLADGLPMDTELDKAIETDVKVKNVSIWSIDEHESKKNTFVITFHVSLECGKAIKERVYTLEVYRKNAAYAVVKLPILASHVKKATINVNSRMETTSLSQKEQEGIEKFLRTFFSIYPKANEEELKYYGTSLLPIKQPLVFEELANIQAAEKKKVFEIRCEVLYQDQETKLRHTMSYELTIKQLANGNFRIEAIH